MIRDELDDKQDVDDKEEIDDKQKVDVKEKVDDKEEIVDRFKKTEDRLFYKYIHYNLQINLRSRDMIMGLQLHRLCPNNPLNYIQVLLLLSNYVSSITP